MSEFVAAPGDECRFPWYTWIARLHGHRHMCVRPFGHDADPHKAIHRCACGKVKMTTADIYAGVRQTYGLKDERDR